MLRAATIIFLSNGVGTALSFLRNVLIGRMVSVEDFGIVSTFALAFAIIQTATYAGFDQLLVQAKDGNNEYFQANLQFLQVLRGVTGAIFFLILAWPYAWLLDNLEIYWAYLVMSVVPLIRGFIHFDIYRFQRQLDFVPTGIVTVGSPLASLLITALLIWIIDDYRIILIAIFSQQILFVVLSHLVSLRKWQISWNKVVALRAIHFSWPLLVNGILVFAIHNGDMLLVGIFFNMETLGWFYVATLLTVTFSLHLDTTVRSISLPGLSRAMGDRMQFSRRSLETLEMAVAAAIIILTTIHLAGPGLVHILFGSRYDQALPYLVPLAVLYSIKSLKSGPNVIALAMGRTRLPMYTNLPRGVSLFISAALLWKGGSIATLITVAICAESFCVIIAYYMILVSNSNRTIEIRRAMRLMCLFVIVLLAVTLDAIIFPSVPNLIGALPLSRLLIGIIAFGAVLMLPALRRYILGRISHFISSIR